jgi:dTDP-4-amino-4,6-dideoxygalactose transaminase
MGGQHMGRSPEEGFPEELRPYVDSLVYTYRINPLNAVLLSEQITKIDAENEARRLNVAAFRTAMEGVQSISFPNYPEGDLPSYHMLTMNYRPEVTGVSRDTYIEALRAEGVSLFAYVPAPISNWRRLQWQNYDGPKVMWTETLRQNGIDYSQVEAPNCEHKIAHSLEISWNYIDVDEAKMTRMASAFEKVEANLGALREWERKPHAS